MRKVVLFIAMSLDGYIADSNGGVGWLNGHGNDNENIDTYSEFTKNIDTVLMGWNTYHQIVTELSPTEWIYGDFTTYVITHNKSNSNEQILFIDENPIDLLEKLKQQDGKDIWICGGANLVQQLMCADLIYRYYISVIPTLLGKGIKLFGEFSTEQKLSLVQTRNYNGIVELVYEHRQLLDFEKS